VKAIADNSRPHLAVSRVGPSATIEVDREQKKASQAHQRPEQPTVPLRGKAFLAEEENAPPKGQKQARHPCPAHGTDVWQTTNDLFNYAHKQRPPSGAD